MNSYLPAILLWTKGGTRVLTHSHIERMIFGHWLDIFGPSGVGVFRDISGISEFWRRKRTQQHFWCTPRPWPTLLAIRRQRSTQGHWSYHGLSISIRYGKSSGLKRGFEAAGSALRRKSTMDWQKLKTLLYQPLVLLEKVVKREVEGPRRPVQPMSEKFHRPKLWDKQLFEIFDVQGRSVLESFSWHFRLIFAPPDLVQEGCAAGTPP